MNRADRPPAVRRWLRRPLLVLVACLGLAGWLTFIDAQDVKEDEREFSRGLRVTAQPDRDWDGGAGIDLTYLHPSGQVVRARTYVWHTDLIPDPGEPLDVLVSTRDPTYVRLVGDRYEASDQLTYVLFAVPPLLVWAARRWSLARSARSARSDPVAYQMRAVASSPGWWSWRWRIHLYSLDSAPGASPVCTAPLIAQPAALGERIAEVKGSPRPWGRVVIRDQANEEVLWPSGRCLRNQGWGRRSLEPGQHVPPSMASRWLMAAGVVVCFIGGVVDAFVDDSVDVEDRGYRVEARVVGQDRVADGTETDVHLEWLGEPIDATVRTTASQAIGDPIEVFLDPVKPTRVWAPGEYAPGGDLVGFIYLAGLGLLIAGAINRIVVRSRRRRPLGPPPPQHWPGSANPVRPLPPPPPRWPEPPRAAP